MKLHVLSENIQKKLPFVLHAISTKSSLPSLLNFLLEAKGGTLHILATDLEIGIDVEIPANIEIEGTTCIPAKAFAELVGAISSEKILLELKDKTLSFTTKGVRSSFQTVSPSDFPKLFEEKGAEVMSFSEKEIKKSFGNVVFATSIDASRPALSGMLIEIAGDGTTFVGTDGYRLSLQKASGKSGKKDIRKKLIIPSRVIREVLSLKTGEKNITLFVSEKDNQVLFEGEGVVIVGRLIDAEFPNYEKIIPQETKTTVLFDKEEMQKAVKITAIFARDAANIIRFSIEKGKIIVSSQSSAIGENAVDVEADLTGDENEIAFNVRFLQDFLTNVEAKEVELTMTGSLNPGVFRIKDDPSFLHLIMPVRVQG